MYFNYCDILRQEQKSIASIIINEESDTPHKQNESNDQLGKNESTGARSSILFHASKMHK